MSWDDGVRINGFLPYPGRSVPLQAQILSLVVKVISWCCCRRCFWWRLCRDLSRRQIDSWHCERDDRAIGIDGWFIVGGFIIKGVVAGIEAEIVMRGRAGRNPRAVGVEPVASVGL